MLENNISEHVKHSNELFKKPMIQGTLKQTLVNIKTRPYPMRTTAEKDSTHEERRANCTHQCKECSNQSVKNPTKQPENSEDNQWRVVRGNQKSWSNPNLITIRKQSKTVDWSPKEPLLIYNTFKGLKEVYEDANNSTERVREAESLPICTLKLSDPSSLRQLFNQIANDEFD